MKRAGSSIAGGIAALAFIAAIARAPAQPLPAKATASPVASSAPAAAQAGELPTLAADPPGPERTRLPSAAEWAKAPRVALTRAEGPAAVCVAYRVREWLRVRCLVDTFAISLLGGPTAGLAFWIGNESEGRPGEVQFPLRRGEQRVVQFWGQRKDGEQLVPRPLFTVQQKWPAGDPAPTVIVQ